MTEQEQIEEMAKIYCKTEFLCNKGCQTEGCRIYGICDTLYNAGYRKVPEDSVVLSREEYDEIKTYQSYIPEMKKAFDKIRNATIKETARKILQTLYNYPHEWHEMKIKELAKEYGVEVE